MFVTHQRLNRFRLGIALLAMLPLGCEGQEVADADEARSALVSVLDAWQKGQSFEDATKGGLGLTISDPSWKSGFKLSKYEVASETTNSGLDRTIPVELWLQDLKGKSVRKKVKYNISLTPSKTVLRSPF